jgi:phosphohistidine swiveling domain-containing protein
VLYRRSVQSLQPIPMVPGGVARQVQLQADGRQLAVQVSRGGIWQVDLVQIP